MGGVRAVLVLLAATLLSGAVLACGRVPASGSGAAATPGQPVQSGSNRERSLPPADARQAVAVQLKAGADPNAVGARVLGPNAFVSSAVRGVNPPIGPAGRRTYLIPVPPDQEQAALSRARGDADVERAQLVPWPPDVP